MQKITISTGVVNVTNCLNLNLCIAVTDPLITDCKHFMTQLESVKVTC